MQCSYNRQHICQDKKLSKTKSPVPCNLVLPYVTVYHKTSKKIYTFIMIYNAITFFTYEIKWILIIEFDNILVLVDCCKNICLPFFKYFIFIVLVCALCFKIGFQNKYAFFIISIM